MSTLVVTNLSLGAGGLPDGSVLTSDIADGAITGPKIAAGAVSAADLDGNQSGSAPIYGARAWVNFDGTGTFSPNPSTTKIRASGNVSSITDNGTGSFSVNFATAMPDTNYSVCVTARRTNANDFNYGAMLKGTTSAGTNYPLSTTSFDVICGTVTNATFQDSDVFCVSVFR